MPTRSCHASTVVELKDGSILTAWFGGTAEGRPDVAIWSARRTSAGWQPPAELAREPQIAAYNPVLFHNGEGLLWFYYKFGPHPSEWTAARRHSKDEGVTWSPVEHLPAGLYGPIRAKPLVLADGVIVSGTSVESYHSWAAWIERSTDDGKTWKRIGPITVPLDADKQKEVADSGQTYGIIQPTVISMGGNHLRFYARSSKNIARICISDSYDLGLTWTPAHPTDLPNPNSGIDVVHLRDGRFVLVYNNTTTGRTPLNLAVSHDGDHWTMFQALETDPGEYSYPAMVQAKNGDLLITYTWKRQKIRFVRLPLSKVPN
ncbi:MAG TPA: sialidase family protein [Bryobacteraceae bacterium]|nr:sialidase family protein [Bryobacteraceae bacterium]